MKLIERKHNIEKKDLLADELILSTETKEVFTFKEATKILAEQEKAVEQLHLEKKNLQDWIAKKGWEEKLDELEDRLVQTQRIIDTMREATTEYLDKKVAEGLLLVGKKKKERHYSRATGDSKLALRSTILNEVRADLGFNDIGDPIMMRIREQFDKVKA